ncbi:uncharacterized protein THITE_2114293 [Thermothielavioides terrestris NRRL 8126]|uniref:Uncharacterized protein n=1 Tax=Thermothielavioides terrestris (strain ATCC 38088 / NRRL 8126) TaxID=578455 RepID=G2QZ60_THETT|nr:uncharacterized protein THITE_2114293 [Thermothielavioides terrestris NRRL 8126]AEO66296.1 hypothetical protein THITE_2114293 [Thermothielavioides terrestris NRRL 8126]
MQVLKRPGLSWDAQGLLQRDGEGTNFLAVRHDPGLPAWRDNESAQLMPLLDSEGGWTSHLSAGHRAGIRGDGTVDPRDLTVLESTPPDLDFPKDALWNAGSLPISSAQSPSCLYQGVTSFADVDLSFSASEPGQFLGIDAWALLDTFTPGASVSSVAFPQVSHVLDA